MASAPEPRGFVLTGTESSLFHEPGAGPLSRALSLGLVLHSLATLATPVVGEAGGFVTGCLLSLPPADGDSNRRSFGRPGVTQIVPSLRLWCR